MDKKVLDIEQVNFLRDLGVDTSNASLCWCENLNDGTNEIQIHDDSAYSKGWVKVTPTFTLHELLDLLPKYIYDIKSSTYGFLYIGYGYYSKIVAYGVINKYGFETWHSEDIGESIVDAVYNLLLWCIDNGYVETKEQHE